MRAKREMPVNNLRKVVLPQISEGLGQIVHNESIMVREEIVPHLRDFPSRNVKVQTIDESHVIADNIRHRRK